MFYHGFDSYMKYGFPEDEIRPISCSPLTRDRHNPAHIELNDALANYSLTLIDSLSTLAILTSSSSTHRGKNKALTQFKSGVRRIVEQYGDGRGVGKRGRGFDLDSKVQVFETVIRGVGGLLSAHLFAVGELPMTGYHPRTQRKTHISGTGEVLKVKWSRSFTYDGQLLRLAHDLGTRLLPAFDTPTGIPYPRVNLRQGVPFYSNSPFNQNVENGQCPTTQQSTGELTENCSAGAGSLVLEFVTLSRLTGDPRFEQLAKRAFWSIWSRRSAIGLVGAGIDSESGQWTSPYTGIGAGIDSFYEYAAKAAILLSNLPLPHAFNESTEQTAEAFQSAWRESHAAIKRHLYRGDQYTHPHYVQADLYTGAPRAFWLDSLSAFYPGLLALTGEVEEAVGAHLLTTALWTKYSALPERWSSHNGGIEGGLGWWGGRPEFIESTYHLFRATQDPWYLHVGEMALRDIKRRCWSRCGWSSIQDVRTGDRNDRMESFFLGETTKYLFLLFDSEHPLNKLDAPFVFNTEGHPLIVPRSSLPRPNHSTQSTRTSRNGTGVIPSSCPAPPQALPFSLSVTAARTDVFHAAKLARLMPHQENLESPLMEYSRDHPSISLSDVRSPSNYTYFPWTIPLELIPHDGFCSQITMRPTFDITFPPAPNSVVGPGFLQRVGNGILINSMGGVRLGMIQDVPEQQDSTKDQYRVQAINNIVLGKDERIFLAKDTASSLVNPLDPNFTRVRDVVMLDLVIDTKSSLRIVSHTSTSTIKPTATEDSMQQVLSALIQQVASLMGTQAQVQPPNTADHPREYLPAIMPMGAGAAPLPDVEEAQGPDVQGAPQGSLLWKSIFVADENCASKLPTDVPKQTQVLVLKRGGCSFTKKLENIPMFLPSPRSLQLVVVVSYDEEQESGVPDGWLVRPLLETTQTTSSGLMRHHPIPMVMVGGGSKTYDMFKGATGLGIKRRYSIQAQGIPIGNLVIL